MKTPFFFADWLAELVFPRGCARCGTPLLPPEAPFGLCSDCRNRLLDVFSGDRRRCAVCGKPLVSEREICMACRRVPERSFDRVFSVFPYQGDCRRILRAYKFASQRNLGRFFRDCLVQAAASPFWENRLAPEKPGAPAWVPVPPRPGKIRKTGWDQVEFLAKLLEKDGKEVCRCLERLGSDTQKILGREKRRNNLRGKIRIRNDYAANKKPIPETALVFDDVYTTGSTMDACAEALKMGGTTTVYGICLFYG